MSQSNQRGRKVQSESKKPSFRAFYIIVGVIAIAGLAWLVTYAIGQGQGSQAVAPATDSSEADYSSGQTPEGFYYKGDAEAPVTVVEYADYTCPHCADFVSSSIYQQITEEYVANGQVQYIFHDYPLSPQTNAGVASEASYCAGDQGEFWAMHEEIFLTQQQWSTIQRQGAVTFFGTLAEDLGLDSEMFATCMAEGTYQEHVAQARNSAMQAQIPGTPSFVVNGQAPLNALELTPAIDRALAAQGGS
jgi:protein-disulfide isomerase